MFCIETSLQPRLPVIEPSARLCRLWHKAVRASRRSIVQGRGIRMKNWLSTRAALALALAASFLALAQPARPEKRVALVIGNNDYKNVPKLQKAVNDARTWAIRSSNSAFP
jgi:hypothetical protein